MSKLVGLSTLLFFGGVEVNGFCLPRQSHTITPAPTVLNAKGFGSKDTPSSNTSAEPTPVASEPSIAPSNSMTSPLSEPDMSMGKAALEKMRRERAEQRNAELQKVKEVQDVDAMLRESPEAAVIPERVAQRMGKRMLPFVGVPLFGAMGSFVGFWYMATYRDMEFQPALVATTTIVLLAVGLLGITYSIMSASWDPDREGSLLGTEEFSKNIDNIKTGLSRSRENAILRDRAGEYSEAEWARLEQQQQQQEAIKAKRTQSFQDKFGDEME